MRRYAKDNRPKLKPVEKIQLSEKHVGLRLTIAAVLAVIGVVFLSLGVSSCLSSDDGWREIEASGADGANCSAEFVFQYKTGSAGVSAAAEYKKLSSLYGEASVYATRLFSADGIYPAVGNMGLLNSSPGETAELDDDLYKALSLLCESGRRDIYLAPVFECYYSVFNSVGDAEAESYDPMRNENAASYVSTLCGFASDPEAVNIQLLGEGRAKLVVSEEYKKFADEHGITVYADFGWMKNAFIADCLADRMISEGYTLGVLSSYDGFCRNLGGADENFSFNIFAKRGDNIYAAARMNYSGARSIVLLRGYMQNSLDVMHYYSYEDGDVRAPYIDITDGFPRCAANEITFSSMTKGCAEILVNAAPVYIADSLDADKLRSLANGGIYSVWCDGEAICHTEKNIAFSDVYSTDELNCNVVYVNADE